MAIISRIGIFLGFAVHCTTANGEDTAHKRMFKEVDADKDGAASLEELLAHLTKDLKNDAPKMDKENNTEAFVEKTLSWAKDTFKEVDADNTGGLNLQEYSSFIGKFGEYFGFAEDGGQDENGGQGEDEQGGGEYGEQNAEGGGEEWGGEQGEQGEQGGQGDYGEGNGEEGEEQQGDGGFNATEMFTDCDKDQDGSVSLEEVTAHITEDIQRDQGDNSSSSSLTVESAVASAKEVFKEADADGNELLSLSEYETFVEKLGTILSGGGDSQDSQQQDYGSQEGL